MAGKMSFLAGIGAGYVLGARAGRERYEQIVTKARDLWRDPRVQEKASHAQHVVQEKASHAQDAVKHRVASHTSGHGEPTTPTWPTDAGADRGGTLP